MVRRVFEIKVTLNFNFQLMLCSREDAKFGNICLNKFEGIKSLNFKMWFKKYRLETPFKCDNVKVLIKRQIVQNWCFISRRKNNIFQHFVLLFCFQRPNNHLEMVLAPPYDQKCLR